jgi:exosome complex component RRP4
VDVGGRQHASLLLSSVNLPGGIQRRRTQEDSLNMRAFFAENDVISAEVQKLRHDGGLSLHTRNLKYGKLSNGSLVRVPSNLVKRCKQHFQHLGPDIAVEVILGLNGFVWVQEAPVERSNEEAAAAAAEGGQAAAAAAAESEEGTPATYTPVTLAGRERVCRVRNSILALARMLMPIYHATISDVYLASVSYGLPAKDLLSSQADLQRITQAAMERTLQA